MAGFLVYLFPEHRRGAGRVTVATHAKFDKGYFSARKHEKRIHDLLNTSSSLSTTSSMEREQSLREEGTATVVEFNLNEDEEMGAKEDGTVPKFVTGVVPTPINTTTPNSTPSITNELLTLNEETNLLHAIGGTPEIARNQLDLHTTNTDQPSRFLELEAMILRRLQEHGHSLMTPEKRTAHEHHACTRIDPDISEFGIDVDEIADPDQIEDQGINLRSGRVLAATRAIAKELGPHVQNQTHVNPIPAELKKACASAARRTPVPPRQGCVRGEKNPSKQKAHPHPTCPQNQAQFGRHDRQVQMQVRCPWVPTTCWP
jgi:hypothetical protein